MYSVHEAFSKQVLWIPYEDKGLPEAVKREVDKYYGPNQDTAYSTFSWEDEDNEDCPAIAAYLQEKNIFSCFVDCSGLQDEEAMSVANVERIKLFGEFARGSS